MVTQFPVWQTFCDAVLYFRTHLGLFIKGMAIPLIIFIGTILLQIFPQPQAISPAEWLSAGLGNLLQPFLILWMANICYRLAITGMPGKLWWSMAETWTIIAVILLGIVVALGAGIPAAIVYFGLTGLNASLLMTSIVTGIVYAGLLLYLTARFALMFPGIAINSSIDIQNAWKMSAHNAWGIIVLVMLPLLIIGTVLALISGILMLILPPPTSFIISFIFAQIGSVVIFCVNGTALGLAYKQLK